MDRAIAVKEDRPLTLNERLNRMAETLQYQNERINAVLDRVNGASPTPIASGSAAQTKPPILPMTMALEGLENAMQRLADLMTGVERIA